MIEEGKEIGLKVGRRRYRWRTVLAWLFRVRKASRCSEDRVLTPRSWDFETGMTTARLIDLFF